MLRRAFLTVIAVVLLPATVHAFDHEHHHDDDDSDGAHGGCSSSDDGRSTEGAGTATPTPAFAPGYTPPAARKHVFVTSTAFSGALGGLDAADMYCEAAAAGGGRPGKYKAWLSGPATNAFDRIDDVGPWYSTHDVQVFASKPDLRGSPQAEITDEVGDQAVLLAGVWTGTDAQGNATVETCNGWTDATPAASATTGTTESGDAMWGGGNAPLSCDSHAPILCFEQ